MKKIYLLALSVFAILTASAQYRLDPGSMGREPMRGEQTSVQSVQLPENRETIYTNDFSVCGDWTTVNAFDAGYPAFITGINFQCGTGVPSGAASIDPIASTTASNGYMMVDSDLFGGTTGGSWVENCWFQNTQPINCALAAHVSLKFETFYRMWDGGADDGNEYCLVEVSTDGVTWPDVNTFEVADAPAGTRYELWPTMLTQDPVENPTLKIFDISSIAAGQATVYLRFRWKGTFGYAWMVDDLELFVTPQNDVTINKGYNGDIVNDFEYYVLPVSQLVDLSFGASVTNYSYTDQTNVPITFNITGGPTVTETIASLPASSSDTIWTTPFALPNAVGAYNYSVSVPADGFPEGNTFSGSYEISQYDFGHASNNCPIQRTLNDDAQVGMGNLYRMNADDQAYGVKVWFGANTDQLIIVQAIVWQITGASIQDNPTFVGQSAEWTLTTEIDNGYHNFPVFNEAGDGPIDLIAGETYMVEIRKIDESSSRMYVRADLYDADLGTFIWGPFAAGGAVNWFNQLSYTPAVRLSFDPASGVGVESSIGGLSLGQNIPNPAAGTTKITYSVNTPSVVQFVVRDISGRIVKSENLDARSSGQHSITLNTDELGSGVYSYTLIANGTQITKKMVVR
jgi:hypothetical protein